MAHAFADDADRDAFRFGGARPAVASNIHRKGNFYTYQPAYRLETVIYVITYIMIGAPLVHSPMPDDR